MALTIFLITTVLTWMLSVQYFKNDCHGKILGHLHIEVLDKSSPSNNTPSAYGIKFTVITLAIVSLLHQTFSLSICYHNPPNSSTLTQQVSKPHLIKCLLGPRSVCLAQLWSKISSCALGVSLQVFRLFWYPKEIWIWQVGGYTVPGRHAALTLVALLEFAFFQALAFEIDPCMVAHI